MSTALRSAILHVTAARGGGVDRHIRDLASAIPRRHLILHIGAALDVLEDVEGRRFTPLRDVSGRAEDGAALAAWLRAAGVGVLHLHSVGEDCRRRVAALGGAGAFPYIVSLHDLTFVNPRAFELSGAPEPDADWIAGLEGALAGAGAIVAPSAFIRDASLRAFPGLAIVTIAEGIRTARSRQVPAVPADFAASAPAHVVAIVGAVGPHKGSSVVDALAESLDGTDIGLVVVGYTDRRLLRGWQVPARCYIHGPYLDDELPGWLAAYRAEIALFPNRMPESFSYTLSEVWAAGVPVVVPDCGAQGERVARHGGGWRLPPGFGAPDASALLVRLFSPEGAAERAAVKSQLATPDNLRVPTIEAMARDTDALYERFALTPAAPIATSELPALGPLLAANLDGFEFRKELIKLTGEFAAAGAWIEKLEADVRDVNAELGRANDWNRVLADQKAAFDLLPAFVRRFLLWKALHARR